jgi:CPA1 family monovalent cation:H+ antiporter
VAQRRLEALAVERGLPDDLAAHLRARHAQRLAPFPQTAADGWENTALAAEMRMALIAAEREHLYGLLREGRISDETRRRLERELDLEEAAIACKDDDDNEPPL